MQGGAVRAFQPGCLVQRAVAALGPEPGRFHVNPAPTFTVLQRMDLSAPAWTLLTFGRMKFQLRCVYVHARFSNIMLCSSCSLFLRGQLLAQGPSLVALNIVTK